MEMDQKSLLRKAISSDRKLERLYNVHQTLDVAIAKASRRRYLTPREETTLRSMKIRKLSALEAMLALVKISPDHQAA